MACESQVMSHKHGFEPMPWRACVECAVSGSASLPLGGLDTGRELIFSFSPKMKTVSPSKPSSGKTTSNPNFEQLKPKSSKQLEDIFSDAKGDDSDDVSVLSDGMTTDDGGFNV